METEATQPHSGSSAATTIYPRWVMLERYVHREADDSCSTEDTKTTVATRTSTGHRIHVSFRLAAPPAPSRLYFHLPNGIKSYPRVIAAHGDSVLIQVSLDERWDKYTIDHFVYNAGDAAADPPRPPSLALLPPYYFTATETDGLFFRLSGTMLHRLDKYGTGLLRRGEDELVVAELRMAPSEGDKVAELLLLRSGEWSVKRPPIVYGDGKDGELVLSTWKTHTVVPIGDGGLLSWVDISQGLLFCDVFDESPVLRYVPLPVEHFLGRNVCVTAGGALKFVTISPRCGSCNVECPLTHHANTIKTWMLRMDDMAWVTDGMVDATELWALDAYKGLPRVQLNYLVVSMDEPHAICFLVCERYRVKYGEMKFWLIMVDMRAKTIRSVIPYPEGRWPTRGETPIPCRVSDYFNSYQSSSSDGTLSANKSHMEEVLPVHDLRTEDFCRHSMQS